MSYSTFAISIEGVAGEDAVTYPGGAMFYIGEEPPASALGNYEWIPGLRAFPRFSAMSAEPLAATLVASSTTFSLFRTSIAARRLLATRKRFAKSLQAEISSSTTNFDLAQSGAIPVGSTLFVGDEAMLVTASTAGGNVTVTRGRLGTRASLHAAGAFASVDQSPFVAGRVVRAWVVKSDGVRVQRWEGIVERPSVSNFEIELTCRANPAFWAGGQLNLNAVDLQYTGNVWFSGQRIAGDIEIDDAHVSGEVVTLGVQSVASRVFKPSVASQKPCAMRVGDALTVGYVVGVTEIHFIQVPPLLGSKFKAESNTEIVNEAQFSLQIRAGGPVQEVFLVSQAADAYTAANFNGKKISATRDLPYPYHPLSICAALLFSDKNASLDALGYNVLNGEFWACDYIGLASSDVLDGLNTLIEQTADIKVDYLLLGWDGEPVDVMEVVRGLLKQYGFWIPTNERGQFRFGQAGLIDVYGASDAIAQPLEIRTIGGPGLGLQSEDARGAETLNLEVGRLPWRKPRNIPVTINGVSDRRQKLGSNRAVKLQLDTVSPSNFLAVKELFVRLALLYYEAPPRINLTVQEVDGHRFGLGEIKRLPALPIWRLILSQTTGAAERYAWLLDRSGVETADTASDSFLGRIVASIWRPDSKTFEITLELTNFYVGGVAKLRGPASTISNSNVSGGKSILTLGTNLSLVGAGHFRAGDQVEFFKVNGAHSTDFASVYEIESISGNDVTLTTDLGTKRANATGEIMRLAFLKAASGWDNPNAFLALVARPWVYQGSDVGEFADEVTLDYGDDIGDIYG